MNKKILLGTGLALTIVLAVGGYHKAFAVTDTSDVEATILAAITVDCSTSTLNFGSIIPHATNPGAVTVTTAGAGSDDGNATYIGGAAAGNCTVEGSAVPADIAITNISNVDDGVGGGAPMTVSNFTLSYNGGAAAAAPIVSNLVPAGAPLLIGAELTVGIAQAAGVYTGTFDVDVQYQ